MQLINKIKGFFIMTERNLLVVCVTVVLITAISSVAYYNMQKDTLMSANIENGIVKGVDPLAIKCAYDSQGNLCLVYAASKHGDAPVGRK
jgi:hypothetical protein